MPHPRILVVAFSRTGHTRRIAEAIAEALGADLETIVPLGPPRTGVTGYVRCSAESLLGILPALQREVHDAAVYDLVVVGTPTWNAGVSSPVRTWLRDNAERMHDVAFFCTCGGFGPDRVMRQMEQLAGRRPRAKLILRLRDLEDGSHAARVAQFVDAVRPPAREEPAAPEKARTSPGNGHRAAR
ncbi:MAG: NAD(P)H-dependent oxidoreductase [Deltaproteobacteria bacterium]|nr:NAD(P)H-dependent oxidoreductase [Deltaproteobacteria bacterium]